MKNIKKDKRGWIRIVEAFVAVLLIAGIILVILDKGYIGKSDISDEVYKEQEAMLREIQLNDSLRGAVLSASPLPVETTQLGFPSSIDSKITEMPSYLYCKGRICSTDDDCIAQLIPPNAGDIYVKSVAITSAQGNYEARQLKMFCWLKD
jgi:hypothetical protein